MKYRLLCGWLSILLSLYCQADEPKVLRMSAVEHMQIPPIYWVDTCQHLPKGMIWEVVNAAFDKINYRMQPEWLSLDLLRDKSTAEILETTRVSIMAVDSRLPRSSALVYSEQPVAQLYPSVFILKENAHEYRDIKDLDNRRGLIIATGQTIAAAKQKLLPASPQMREVATTQKALNEVRDGKADFIFGDRLTLIAYIRSHGLEGEFSQAKLNMKLSYSLFLAMLNNVENSKILKDLDAVIADYYRSGMINQITVGVLKSWVDHGKNSCDHEKASPGPWRDVSQ